MEMSLDHFPSLPESGPGVADVQKNTSWPFPGHRVKRSENKLELA